MNKIKVNMAVEPNDIQTLHCSQYDTEERKFSVELHENGVGVSPSSISNQLVYKSFKGGTEQILPTNTSTPSTSPIIADIDYKDGLREDEEFLYRESPSDVDGYAKIKEIRGNTLVWNQQVRNGDFSDSTNNWSKGSGTWSVSNGVLTVTVPQWNGAYQVLPQMAGHKVLAIATCKASATSGGQMAVRGRTTSSDYDTDVTNIDSTSWKTYAKTVNISASRTLDTMLLFQNASSSNLTIDIKNVMLIDLTQMGYDSLTASEFTSLFPLSYYNYTQGELLSFNGGGIKTTGKNYWENSSVTVSGQITKTDTGITFTQATSTSIANYPFPINVGSFMDGATFTISFDAYTDVNGAEVRFDGQPDSLYSSSTQLGQDHIIVLTTTKTKYVYTGTLLGGNVSLRFFRTSSHQHFSTSNIFISNIQLELGSSDSAYEPYEEHYLPMPITSYFPTGLKSAGSIYDQLDETGYITRVGEVDLGSLTWTYYSSANRFYTTQVPSNMVYNNDTGIVPNIASSRYQATTPTGTFNSSSDKLISILQNYIFLVDKSTTDPNTLKTNLSGVKMQYELATPLENYGVVDLGSLSWTYDSTNSFFNTISLDGELKATDTYANLLCDQYNFIGRGASGTMASASNMSIAYFGGGANESQVRIKNTSYTDANTFKNAMSGVYLLYEKSNPQGIKTASIVTNYGEMPLYNDNGELKADCIADVSQNSGFQIAKVKLKDENGEIYSNPFQIHTERSPI